MSMLKGVVFFPYKVWGKTEGIGDVRFRGDKMPVMKFGKDLCRRQKGRNPEEEKEGKWTLLGSTGKITSPLTAFQYDE